MRAQRARRLAAVSAAGILMASGSAIGAAGTASAAPAVHTQVTTNRCGDRNDRGGGCFDDRFDHHGFRFDDRFDHGFRFDHRFDHHDSFFHPGGVVIIVL